MNTVKTNSLFSFNYYAVKALVVFTFLSLLMLSACNKDKESIAPVAPFEGQYEGTKANNNKYTMIIERKGGPSFQIKNFAGFLNAPLNATATGNTLTIPKQTFTNTNGNQLILSGTGTLSADTSELSIEYSVKGFTEYESEEVFKRKTK